jgi:putative membrane protein
MKIALPLIAAVTLVSAGALAQQPNAPQQANPPQTTPQQNARGQNAPNDQQLSPQDFVQKVESGTHYEVGASQLAVRKTQDPMIRRFAARMVSDHSFAAAALEVTIAVDRAVDLPADTPMSSDQTKMIDALNSASAGDFDNLYVQQMVDDHHQALSLFDDYAQNGSDPRLKLFARKTLPIIHAHLIMVERLQRMASRASNPTTGRSSSGGAAGANGPQPAPSPQPVPPNARTPGGGAATQPLAPSPSMGSGNQL